MSVTGVALTYQKQMTEWADRSYWPTAAPAPAGQQRLSVADLILKAAEAQSDGQPSAITFYADPKAPAMVASAPGQNVFVNRFTGETAVGGSTVIRTFFRFVTDWHRYLGAAGENRATGKAITGACNLAFLFIVSSGIYLWWPRNWTRQSVRSITWFKRGLSARSRDFNWHNVFGFWAAIPLFFVVLSATVISYPWASNLVYQIAGTPPPVRNQPRPVPERGGERRGPNPDNNRVASLDLTQVDAFLLRVEEQIPDWRTINLRLPTGADRQITFSVDRSFGGRPQMRSTIVFDRNTGVIARTQT